MNNSISLPIRLTETVQKGGCAAKLPAGTLSNILKQLQPKSAPELLLGVETMDDAALWNLGGDRLLIQTVDFFTPMIDDPFDFGAVAAANALSDIYAMGGYPATALTVLAFPTQILDDSLLLDLMKGALSKIEEAGACLVGGHSIDDETLKLGFSVNGFVSKTKAWKNDGARIGDAVILTKPLGTGTLCSAIKQKKAKPEWIEAAVKSMKALNRVPELMGEIAVHSATDVTGFGLAGHAFQVAQASSVSIAFSTAALPALPGAKSCLENKILNRAHRTNAEYVANRVGFHSQVPEIDRHLCFDAQTSGGLLLFVASEHSDEVLDRLRPNFPHVQRVGVVGPPSNGGPLISFS